MTGKRTCASGLTHWWGCRNARRPLKAVFIFSVLAAMVFGGSGYLGAAENAPSSLEKETRNDSGEAASRTTRYRVISLRHIPAQKGKQWLSELGVGTVSQLPGANMLLVTAEPNELNKATAVLGLVDSKEEYALRTILSSWSMLDHASIDRISATLGDLVIGTFSSPPVAIGQPKAIVDVHHGALITIAPANQLDRIMSAFGRGPAQPAGTAPTPALGVAPTEPSVLVQPEPAFEPNQSERPTLVPGPPALEAAEPLQGADVPEAGKVVTTPPADLARAAASGEPAGRSDANEPGANGLFAKLLESLAEAEKAAAQGREVNEPLLPVRDVSQGAPPNEPNIVIAPEPSVPNEPNAAAAPQPPVPNEPNVAAAPEPIAPTEEPPTAPGPPMELKDIAVVDILKRLEVLEAATRARAAPKVERVPAEIEPNEVPVAVEKPVSRIEPNEAPEAVEQVPEIEPNEIPGPVEKTAPKVMHPNEANAVAPAVTKAGPGEPKPPAEGDEVLKVVLPETLPIVDFMNFVGQYLKLDYLYDPKELVGNVTFAINGRQRGEIMVKDLYPMLQSVMQFYGFVMTRNNNLVIIRPKEKIDSVNTTIVSGDGNDVATGDVVVTRVFDLQYIDSASAKNLLDQMKLGLSVMPIAETGNLIITGYNYGMPRIEQLLELVDKPGEPKQFTFRKLKYTMAEVLAPKVKTLAEELGTVSVTIAATAPTPPTPTRGTRPPRPTRPSPRPTPTPSPTADQAGKPTVYLEADQRTNRILMIGVADQLAVVNELINALDVVQEDLRSMRSYEIRHVDAEEVRGKLEELGIISVSQAQQTRGPSRRDRITSGGRRTSQPAAGQPATPVQPITALTETAEGPLLEEPQVVIIEPINALLVNATPEQHLQIAMIIGYVDSEAETSVIPYVVYPLENQDPESLATVLNQLIQETVTATARQDKDAKTVPPAATATTQRRTEEDIVIIPDKNTFSLIVYASKRNQQWVRELIAQLDRRRPQVLIDVTLVQVTKDDKFNFDLDLLSAIPDMGYVSGQTDVTNSIYNLLVADDSDRNKFMEMQSIKGDFKGFYGDHKINALLTAAKTKQYGRVMARPKLLVNDNETGSIKTTETTYIERTSTNIIGTETPQTATQTVFDDYSAGITLEITPHISEGDMLRLEITLNRSGFDPETLGKAKPPDKADADVATVVTVPDKSTIILGGVEKVEHGKGGKKIPLLGDLPFIGFAFREVSESGTQNKLYIFVKAHILRPGGDLALADLKDISRMNRDAFESLEREMGDYESWPGIKPAPLDPVRILETE
ncbi:MAG TPA: secretin N-terminal domain-containing protein [Sedimentisphaerales bacterium]|nr:secretin N-terminal domain-containing protein [Sedimentisphaerales bacterium]